MRRKLAVGMTLSEQDVGGSDAQYGGFDPLGALDNGRQRGARGFGTCKSVTIAGIVENDKGVGSTDAGFVVGVEGFELFAKTLPRNGVSGWRRWPRGI